MIPFPPQSWCQLKVFFYFVYSRILILNFINSKLLYYSMGRTIIVIVTSTLLILLLLAWAPWLDDQAIHDKIMWEKAKIDGTIDRNGNLICDYNVRWAPFGRWVASCEGGYYVAFYGEIF